jgi:hypothetical protein
MSTYCISDPFGMGSDERISDRVWLARVIAIVSLVLSLERNSPTDHNDSLIIVNTYVHIHIIIAHRSLELP